MKFLKDAAIISATTLVLLEISLQLYYKISSGNFLFERVALPIYEADETRGFKVQGNLAYRHRTNEFDVVYYTNAAGFRTDERRQPIPIRKEPGRFRVMFLGPSFAFGWANDWRDTYAYLVGEGLDARLGDAEVVNAGVPSQSINAQLCWYEQMGQHYRPDLIVVTLYAEAISALGAECQLPANGFRVDDGYLVQADAGWFSAIKSYAKNFGVVFYGWFVFQTLAADAENPPRQASARTGTADPAASTVSRLRRLRDFLVRTGRHEPTVLLVYVPPSFVVQPADRVRYFHQWTPEPATVVKEVEEIASRLNQEEVIFVNPIEALREADAGGRTYYFLDVHLTPLGNRAVADSILRVLDHDAEFRGEMTGSPDN